MNKHYNTNQPRPGPECGSFAELLALAGQERLNPRDSSALRAHIETCAYCRQEQDAYRSLDSVLQRHFGPPARLPLSSDDIARVMGDDEPLPARRARPSGAATLSDERPRRPASGGTGGPLPGTSQRPPRRRGLFISAISAAAAVLVIALIAAALFASSPLGHTGHSQLPAPTSSPTSNPTPVLPTYQASTYDAFNDIAMVSPDEGWIIGNNHAQQASKSLIIHYVDGHLFQVDYLTLKGQQASDPLLSQIGMLSPSEGWAMGSDGGCNTIFLRYTDGRWRQEPSLPDVNITSISLSSPTDGWAVGYANCQPDTSHMTRLYHYNGTTWTQVAPPSEVGVLNKVVMLSANDGWIIGTSELRESPEKASLLLHYDGKTWARVDAPAIQQETGYLYDIAMASATDGWLVASVLSDTADAGINAYAGAPTQLALFHYDGEQWNRASTVFDAVQPAQLSDLSLTPSGDGWLAFAEGSGTGFLRLAGGTWSQVDDPANFFSLVQIFPLSADDAWVTGYSTSMPVLEHYHNGAWEQVPLTS